MRQHLTRRAPDLVQAERSPNRFCETSIEIKAWAKEPPPVEVARPRRCPGCGEAGHPEGGAPGLVGHGLRERQVRGPLAAREPSGTATLWLRRYRCRGCGAVVAVGPRGLVRRRLYARTSIALALALWSVAGQTAHRVRERVSPWRAVGASVRGWVTLRRWARAATSGALWRGLSCESEPTLRARAARVMALVAANGPPGVELEGRVMAGAVLVR